LDSPFWITAQLTLKSPLTVPGVGTGVAAIENTSHPLTGRQTSGEWKPAP